MAAGALVAVLVALVAGLLAGGIAAWAFWRAKAAQAAARHEAQLAAADRRADGLDRSLAELRAALDLLPGGLVVVDRAGGLIVRNERAGRFLGVAHLDALLEQSLESHLRNALAGDERADTLEILGPPRRTLVVRGSVLSVDDQWAGAVVTIEDISERVRIDSVRTDLVANLSHELKTPVGAIALLAETLADEDEPEVIARLGPKLITEAHRLARIIDELLELSRIELGEQSLAEVVSVTGVVEEAMGLHRALAAARDMSVRADLPELEPDVLGNRRQLVSAVGNLLENAIKYSDAGSEVEVTVSSDAEMVEITVRDHGIGIPGRDLDRIFERFYRVDKARSRETGGSGLGLSIVRHVMTNHGGVVTVTSAEGEGSTFVLRLPVARERHLGAGTAQRRPSAIAAGRVMTRMASNIARRRRGR